jgi:hypothetical protein
MKTDTPRTDEIWGAMLYTYPFLINCVTETGELERELTAVTEQRDRLAEALRECLERLEHHTEFGALVQADMSAMHSSREALQSLTPKDHE